MMWICQNRKETHGSCQKVKIEVHSPHCIEEGKSQWCPQHMYHSLSWWLVTYNMWTSSQRHCLGTESPINSGSWVLPQEFSYLQPSSWVQSCLPNVHAPCNRNRCMCLMPYPCKLTWTWCVALLLMCMKLLVLVLIWQWLGHLACWGQFFWWPTFLQVKHFYS